MRAILIIIFLFISGVVSAASNPPSPTPGEHTANPQAHGTNTKKNTAISNNLPPTSIASVENVPPSKHDNVSENENKERKNYSSPEWGLVEVTILLVLVTGLLAFYTASLWKTTIKLAEDAKATSDRQGQEMQLSLDIAAKQMDLAREQHKLQQWQYFNTHRPRLIIRRISLDGGDGSFGIRGTSNPKIQFIVANVGGSRATIIESNATFAELYGFLPAIPPYSLDISTLKSTIREAGQSDPPEFLYIEDQELSKMVQSWNGATFRDGDNSPYYFFGYIQYRDEIGVVRRMTFCRRYSLVTKRFSEVNDSEYEYGD